MAARAHSIWLTLDAAGEARLAPVIDVLADAFGRPRFRPHVTLLGGLEGEAALTAAAMGRLDWPAARSARVAGAAAGETRFTALFLDMAVSDAFREAREALARELTGAAPPPWRPHLSLAYGPIPPLARARLVARLGEAFRGAEFRIAGVSAVSASSRAPVETWRTLSRRPLPAG